MLFSEYEKMNSSLEKFEDGKSFTKVKWIVTEKVHGANFSFHTDGDIVQAARRRGLLRDGENFFNHLEAEFMKTYPDKIRDVYNAVCKQQEEKEIKQVSVYGELFGGMYIVDGKNLATSKLKPVQKEIQYSPKVEWCAFDISYRTISEPDIQEYVDPDKAMKIFEEFEIFYFKPLFIGPINEAMNYELGFDSTIPKILRLPPLLKGTNKAEGIVVKPLKNLKRMNTRSKEEDRVIVKIKLPGFEEVNVVPISKNGGNAKSKEQKMLPRILAYTTEQRLTNAISKIGHPENVEVEEAIYDEFIKDVFMDIQDCEIDLFKNWESSPEQDKTHITGVIKKKTKGLLNKYKNAR